MTAPQETAGMGLADAYVIGGAIAAALIWMLWSMWTDYRDERRRQREAWRDVEKGGAK